jgi:hypothetical protein
MFRQHNNGAYMSAVRLAIPRVIHQTFYSKQLPESFRQNIAHLKGQNPSFELRLYDDADAKDFIRDELGTAILERFLRIRPEYGAARADLFRYLLIYARGGVYLDVKSTTTRPLEEVLRPNDRFLLSHWANRPGEEHEGWGNEDVRYPGLPEGEFQQWHVIAAPRHPFLQAVIEKTLANIRTYSPWKAGIGKVGTFRTTGPICYTNAILPILPLHPHRLLRTNADLGLRYSIFEQAGHHHSLGKSHYRHRADSVVSARSVATDVSFKTYSFLFRAKRKIQAVTGSGL